MTTFGQFCLLVALVGSGYAAFAAFAARSGEHRTLNRTSIWAAIVAVLALTAATAVLLWALVVKDFRFAYVAEYSSRQLAWYYSLSACWVGQAGSLLLWAWLLGVLTLVFRFSPRREASRLDEIAFGVVATYLCFLVAMMVFAADPMEPSLGAPTDGAGLGPLLQHPVMLLHPPIVFLGYACYAFPCALAIAALLTAEIDANWPRRIRSWALAAWAVLGAGILLGADWAYEELGWGGYWGWDPVENGSLIPWLTGTALVHASMAWQHRGVLKKTALLLAIATMGLCNFAAFVTRSGIFSSVHEFSRSPIGWMFLALMAAIAVAGVVLVLTRRESLLADRPIASIWARESLVVLSGTALVLLAGVVLLGTLSVPLSDMVVAPKIVLGPDFYNTALIPVGLLLLATTALAPLSRWGLAPSPAQRTMLMVSAVMAIVVTVASFAMGVHRPIALGVAGLAGFAAAALLAAIVLDVLRLRKDGLRHALLQSIRDRRRTYAGFLVHAGFVCLAIGVTGSSLGTIKRDFDMDAGETTQWAGRSIHFARLIQQELPDRLMMAAQLDVALSPAAGFTLLPAQHLHRRQRQWTTEVAIHSTWTEDSYAILHGGEAQSRIHLTLVVNPMMRWLWLGGWVAGIGALVGLLPERRRAAERSAVATPQWAKISCHAPSSALRGADDR